MSTIVCLGGYGQFGLPTARMLAARPEVERVVVAGRDGAKAHRAAAELSPKAIGRRVDVDDPASLARGVEDADVVVSTLWEPAKRQDPIIAAAAAAGAHYCDLNGRMPGAEVGEAATAAGVCAVVRAGSAPGLTNLAGRAATAALDDVEGLVGAMAWPAVLDIWDDLFDAYVKLPGNLVRGPSGRRLVETLTSTGADPAAIATVLRDARVVPFWLALLADPSARVERVVVARDGEVHRVHPREEGIDLPRVGGGWHRVRPLVTEAGGSDLPRLAGTPVQSASLSGLSEAFDDVVLAGAERVHAGAAAEDVARELQSELERDPSPFLLPPAEVADLPPYAAVAVGRVGGAVARSSVHLAPGLFRPENWLALTSAALAVTARYLLDGTITARGVVPFDEAVAADDRFERDYAELLPVPPAEGRVLHRRLERA